MNAQLDEETFFAWRNLIFRAFIEEAPPERGKSVTEAIAESCPGRHARASKYWSLHNEG
jgi:hypothetical protein